MAEAEAKAASCGMTTGVNEMDEVATQLEHRDADAAMDQALSQKSGITNETLACTLQEAEVTDETLTCTVGVEPETDLQVATIDAYGSDASMDATADEELMAALHKAEAYGLTCAGRGDLPPTPKETNRSPAVSLGNESADKNRAPAVYDKKNWDAFTRELKKKGGPDKFTEREAKRNLFDMWKACDRDMRKAMTLLIERESRQTSSASSTFSTYRKRDLLKIYTPEKTEIIINDCKRRNTWNPNKYFPKDEEDNFY